VAPRVNLSRHLATIESYLEDYRALLSIPQTDNRQSNRNKFQKYILTSCWMKMHSRAGHWISVGMITSLCNIPDKSLTFAAEQMDGTLNMQIDRDLRSYLKGGLKSDSSGYIDRILEYDSHRWKGIKTDFSVDSIVETKDGEVPYTPGIAVAFHHLLVSSLLSYVIRLRIVDKAVRALSGPPNDAAVSAFGLLHISAQFLFLVSHSELFRKHSKLLSYIPSLTVPTEAFAISYTKEFASIVTLHAKHHANDKLLIGSCNSPSPGPVGVSAVQALDNEESAAAAIEELDAAATDEVLDRVPGQGNHGGVEVVYRRWIMGMVDHFASLRVLERVSAKLPPEGKVNFSILGLNRPKLEYDSWATMVGEIQKLCQDSSLVSLASNKPLPPDFADKAIRIIETKIKDYKASEVVNKTSKWFEAKVYLFFKNLISETPIKRDFSGCGHCEAILMAIIHRIISNKIDLGFSLKVCSP
jgi:hypothetical protein